MYMVSQAPRFFVECTQGRTSFLKASFQSGEMADIHHTNTECNSTLPSKVLPSGPRQRLWGFMNPVML